MASRNLSYYLLNNVVFMYVCICVGRYTSKITQYTIVPNYNSINYYKKKTVDTFSKLFAIDV